LPGDFLGGLIERGIKEDGLKRLSLGEAFKLINKKYCFEERD
jgi:hypothetical protein